MGAIITVQSNGVPLIITGSATVSGVLTLSLPAAPSNGELVAVLQAGSVDGDFDSVVIDTTYEGGSAYTPNEAGDNSCTHRTKPHHAHTPHTSSIFRTHHLPHNSHSTLPQNKCTHTHTHTHTDIPHTTC